MIELVVSVSFGCPPSFRNYVGDTFGSTLGLNNRLRRHLSDVCCREKGKGEPIMPLYQWSKPPTGKKNELLIQIKYYYCWFSIIISYFILKQLTIRKKYIWKVIINMYSIIVCWSTGILASLVRVWASRGTTL